MNTPLLPITFENLLTEHVRIRIPRLQRDYAQGRKGAKESEIRQDFLQVLCDALERSANADFASLNLDFVYGSAETFPDRHFSPLDGQQRLTTLFLLHWLLAWRDGCWEDFTARFREGEDHSRFSYRVRPSSTDFFNELVAHHPPLPVADLKDLKGWITDQPWYYRYWRLDPTIQGTLEMLQAMRDLFAASPHRDLYARLTDPQRPAITFQLLDLGDFPLSDDLYIKMNARGKLLTSFETFKARYEQALSGHFASAPPRPIGNATFPLAEFVLRRFDNAWTDLLWTHHLNRSRVEPKYLAPGQPALPQRLDESFMHIFRLVALATRDPAHADFQADIKRLRDEANPPTYSAFKNHGWLDPAFSALLLSLMESWCVAPTLLPGDSLFREAAVLRQLFENFAGLTVPQVFFLCGYALFLQRYEGRYTPAQFATWMRVVHNLGVNSTIDQNDLLQSPAKGLREMLPNGLDILPVIVRVGPKAGLTGFSAQQQREEALKAALLLADHNGWWPLLKRAEAHGYFSGQIEFLLDFSGTLEEWTQTGNADWDAPTHRRRQQEFLRYLERAEMMFDDTGLAEVDGKRWQRALLSVGDYLLLRGNTNYSFLEPDLPRAYSWKRLLRGGSAGSDEANKRPLLKTLWDQLDAEERKSHAAGTAFTTATLLDAIIDAAVVDEPWRAALVGSAAAVEYCVTIQRDWSFKNQVYLLATTKRSGTHAELFSYILAQQLAEADARQSFAPLSIGSYQESNRRDDPPYLPLHFRWDSADQEIDVYGQDGSFDLWIQLPLPSDLRAILTQAAFIVSTQYSDWLVRTVARDDIEPTLRQLAALLTTP